MLVSGATLPVSSDASVQSGFRDHVPMLPGATLQLTAPWTTAKSVSGLGDSSNGALAAGQRMTRNIALEHASPANVSVATSVSATQPIVVERSLYSNANGLIWAAGTNATATALPEPQ